MGATITSFYFLCFLAGIILLYYVCPKQIRWCVLLLSSIAYYLLSGNGVLIVYPLISTLVAYLGVRLNKDNRKSVMLITVLLLLTPLFALKYVNFFVNTINGITPLVLPNTSFLVPLGISFYTFNILSYVLDVYNGIATRQDNYFKLLTYGMYFSTILSGPIMKYREDSNKFFEEKAFEYKNLTFGAQRMLWGFFKILVISERARMIADSVFNNVNEYAGPFVILGMICYTIQLATNFSGSMDLVLGMSEILGIILPENFQTPFFSKSISEYWRRWHITLGNWMKEYVFYPLLRTKLFMNLQSKLKGSIGKKKAKRITTFTAMFILWLTVGIWHGGAWKFVIGSGLLHWLYIVTGELIEEPFSKLFTKLNIKKDSKVLNALRIIRTFILVAIGLVFFRASSIQDAVILLRRSLILKNAGYIFTGAIFCMGIDWVDFVVLAVSLLILIVVSYLKTYKIDSLRERIGRFNIVVRWALWYALLFYTILLGFYGPGFDAAEFIYQGF